MPVTPKKLKGAGLFSGKSGNKQYQLFHKAKNSEKEFFKLLNEYNKITDKYYKKYQDHIENLIALDESFTGVDSFRKSFELLFNSEDKTNLSKQALLLQNYTDLEPFYEVDDMIKYHLIQQITYLLTKAYSDQERFLIRQITLQNVMTNPEMIVVTVDGKNTGFFKIPHHKYQIDYTQLKGILDQVVDQMRNTLKKSSKPVSLFPTADLKPGTLVNLKGPEAKQSVEIAPVIQPPDPKEEAEKKKMVDVKVPENQPVLPVFKIDIPRKASPKPASPKPASRKKTARKSQKKKSYNKSRNNHGKSRGQNKGRKSKK